MMREEQHLEISVLINTSSSRSCPGHQDHRGDENIPEIQCKISHLQEARTQFPPLPYLDPKGADTEAQQANKDKKLPCR
jgi:hypothetical protein